PVGRRHGRHADPRIRARGSRRADHRLHDRGLVPDAARSPRPDREPGREHRARHQPRRVRRDVQAPRHDRVGVTAPPEMEKPPRTHMTADDFRRHGRDVVDWIADYMEGVEKLPVLSRVRPGDIRAALPADPPQRGELFEVMLEDVDRILLPGITHWQSPNFFAYFPCNNSGPAILGELLS